MFGPPQALEKENVVLLAEPVDPISDRTEQKELRFIVLALLSSNLLSLLIGGLYEYFALRGLVNVALSRIVLVFVWGIATIILLLLLRKLRASRFLPSMAIGAALIAVALIGLDVMTTHLTPAPVPVAENKDCPPGTGICMDSDGSTISNVQSVGSPQGVIVRGKNNRIDNVTSISQIEEYARSPQRTEDLMAALHKEHYEKWQKLPYSEREQRERIAADLEQKIRSVEGDVSKVSPLLTQLWTMR